MDGTPFVSSNTNHLPRTNSADVGTKEYKHIWNPLACSDVQKLEWNLATVFLLFFFFDRDSVEKVNKTNFSTTVIGRISVGQFPLSKRYKDSHKSKLYLFSNALDFGSKWEVRSENGGA